MSVDNFIPTLWSARIEARLRTALVFADVVNRDFEGIISAAGDSVRINGIGPVTIAAYTKDSTTVTPEALNDNSQTLLIDKSPYFAFEVDDVDKAQANVNFMAAGMDEGAWGLANYVDDIIAHLYTGAGSTTTTAAINSVNVNYEFGCVSCSYASGIENVCLAGNLVVRRFVSNRLQF